MRVPIFRVTCDDDPSDPAYPCAVSLQTIYMNGDSVIDDVSGLRKGESDTVGGGAAVQFTLTRIR